MLRDFADVQQSVRARNDLDKCAEIGQPRDFAEIRFPDLGSSGKIADDLQRFRRRSLVV